MNNCLPQTLVNNNLTMNIIACKCNNYREHIFFDQRVSVHL